MAASIEFRFLAFSRWYATAFAVLWVSLAVWMIVLACMNGAVFMVPVLLAVSAIAPLLARRAWGAGVELTDREAIVTQYIGRRRVLDRSQIKGFEVDCNFLEYGPWWTLCVRTADGNLIRTWVGSWWPLRSGKARAAAMAAAANAWLTGDGSS